MNREYKLPAGTRKPAGTRVLVFLARTLPVKRVGPAGVYPPGTQVIKIRVLPLFPSHCLPNYSHPIPTLAYSFSHPASYYWGSYSHSIHHRFSRFAIIRPWMDGLCNFCVGCNSSTGGTWYLVHVFLFFFLVAQLTKLSINHSICQTHSGRKQFSHPG